MPKIGKAKRVHADDKGVEHQANQTVPELNNLTTLAWHPLNNGLVLNVIFEHLPKKDWKSARLVNKTWHSTLQLHWRGQMVNKIGYGTREAKAEAVTTKFLERQHPTINPSDPLQLSSYPIRKISVYKSDNRQRRNRYILLQPAQNRFWELFGHGLKHIDLDNIRIHRGLLLKKLLFELTPSLEGFRYSECVCDDINQLDINSVAEYSPPTIQQMNLTTLKLRISPSYVKQEEFASNEYKPRFPISWIELFSMFPNIKMLRLDMDPVGSGRSSDMLKAFEAIDTIRKANNNEVLNITEFHTIDNGLARVDVIKNQLVFASLPIDSLCLEITHMSRADLIFIIQTFKSTLRDLTLVDFGHYFMYDNLPSDVLPQGLTNLRTRGRLFPSLEFLLYTPNLVELEVNDTPCILPPEVDLAAGAPLVKVKELDYLLDPYSKVSGADMEILVKMMPNVKIGSFCAVDRDGFQVLCREWSNSLEELSLDPKFDDEDFFVENLINLKRLRNVGIESKSLVTDKSVFEGFLKLPFLREIQLSSRAKITDVGRQALDGKLRFYYDDGYDSDESE